MATYKWTFANVGGTTRVRIQSAEDIRHLGELDKKMWTVLSCPVNGLEISSDSLSLMDLDGDGKLRVKEVVATAEWLCATKPANMLYTTLITMKSWMWIRSQLTRPHPYSIKCPSPSKTLKWAT